MSDGEEEVALPPPPVKKPMSLLDQLAGISDNAKAVVDSNAKDTDATEKTMVKQRRRSRDLQLQVDGMYIEEVAALQAAFNKFEIGDTALITKANIKPCLAEGGHKLSAEVRASPCPMSTPCRVCASCSPAPRCGAQETDKLVSGLELTDDGKINFEDLKKGLTAFQGGSPQGKRAGS